MNMSVKSLCRDLFFLMLLISAGGAKAQPHCGDFLAQLSNKPEFVVLLECTQHNDIQENLRGALPRERLGCA